MCKSACSLLAKKNITGNRNENDTEYSGRIFSQAGNELGTSKARGIRDNH
jgi:hypothetical protein